MSTALTADQMAAMGSDRKLALLATLDPGALPHLTLITSLQAKGAGQLMYGQFCEGRAKANVKRDPRASFLVVEASGRILSGTARWTGDATSGDDYEAYNRKPMFRYNAYSGIHLVHYLDLVTLDPECRVNARRTAGAALAVAAARLLASKRAGADALNAWAVRHINSVRTLKFASIVAADGHPRIAAMVPCSALGRGCLLLGSSALGMDTRAIEPGSSVAVLALNLQFESVLVRGRFVARGGPQGRGVIEIEDRLQLDAVQAGPRLSDAAAREGDGAPTHPL